MEKVYLEDGPFKGEVRELQGSELLCQYPPGHVPYKDSGRTLRVFVRNPGVGAPVVHIEVVGDRVTADEEIDGMHSGS